MRLLTAISFASLAIAAPALAAEDEATGLGVNLSDDFIVEATPPQAQYSANFGVKSASGTPANFEGEAYLCQVSFAPAPQNADLSQEEINTMVGSPEWVDMAKQSMSPVFTFEDDTAFELAGYNGHEFIAVPKQEGAENVRLVLSMLETAKGRTAISCVADAETLDEAIDAFRTIRDGVTPPA
ncbi:hypothetical protein VW35_20160 [Devosia soli]|uniref:Uncharacterized protein n=1 Tax=Devosia soli TaxID=361041 RepID=A0A0F5L0X2_9HYPH|nr:hypothetical protein [Devosia soli]KKB76041.1 hypothetical protein VW35_20160 [Devosia soli]